MTYLLKPVDIAIPFQSASPSPTATMVTAAALPGLAKKRVFQSSRSLARQLQQTVETTAN